MADECEPKRTGDQGFKIEQHLNLEKLIQLDPCQLVELQSVDKIEEKLDGLSDLLLDSNVKALIKTVAGNETHSIIEDAVHSIKQNNNVEDKQKIITTSIQKIHSTMKKSDGPAIDLIMSLVGSRGKNL